MRSAPREPAEANLGRIEREVAVLRTMSLALDRRFPHFAACDEHPSYADGVLTWRDRRWES